MFYISKYIMQLNYGNNLVYAYIYTHINCN